MNPYQLFALTTPIFIFAIPYVGVGQKKKVKEKLQRNTVIAILCVTIALEVVASIDYYFHPTT